MRTLGAVFFGVVLLAGCASYDGHSLIPGGSTAAEVEALMGVPAARLAKPDGSRVLYFSRQPMGRENFAATLGPDGKLRGVEQLLTLTNIHRITEGSTNAAGVRELLGPPEPDMVSRLPRQMRDVWEYRWLDREDKRALFVQFSDDGIVREVINLRDDYHESPGTMP